MLNKSANFAEWSCGRCGARKYKPKRHAVHYWYFFKWNANIVSYIMQGVSTVHPSVYINIIEIQTLFDFLELW